MSPYRACIFDLDGTLADTLRSIAYFGNGTLRAFGLPELDVQLYRYLVGDGAAVLMERMLKAANAAPGSVDIAAFRAEYDRRYESEPMRLVAPYPGLPELLTDLKSRGMKLGVISNKPDNMVVFIANALYPSLLDAVHGQLPGVPRKPDPAALLSLAQELDQNPDSILYVGDSGLDMDAGRSAGMDTCGALWGFRGREELMDHGAMFLAEDAAELKEIIEKR